MRSRNPSPAVIRAAIVLGLASTSGAQVPATHQLIRFTVDTIRDNTMTAIDVRARFLSRHGDTIIVQPANSSDTARYATDFVRDLRVSPGQRSRWVAGLGAGIVAGAAAGMIVGRHLGADPRIYCAAFLGPRIRVSNSTCPFGSCGLDSACGPPTECHLTIKCIGVRDKEVAAAALLIPPLGAAGYLIGSRLHVDRWIPAVLDDLAVAVDPASHALRVGSILSIRRPSRP